MLSRPLAVQEFIFGVFALPDSGYSFPFEFSTPCCCCPCAAAAAFVAAFGDAVLRGYYPSRPAEASSSAAAFDLECEACGCGAWAAVEVWRCWLGSGRGECDRISSRVCSAIRHRTHRCFDNEHRYHQSSKDGATVLADLRAFDCERSAHAHKLSPGPEVPEPFVYSPRTQTNLTLRYRQ